MKARGTAAAINPAVSRPAHHGFTLIELMVVVVIVGVLATLAVVGYRKIVQSAHVSEATGMVQNIRVAQEAYHAETQQYASISHTASSWYPATSRYGTATAWGGDCGSLCTGTTWAMLPLHVDGPVLFGYITLAGPANSTPAPVPAPLVNGVALTLPSPSPTDWYYIAAEGDLDNNPAANTDVYGTSWTNQLFVSNEGQ